MFHFSYIRFTDIANNSGNGNIIGAFAVGETLRKTVYFFIERIIIAFCKTNDTVTVEVNSATKRGEHRRMHRGHGNQHRRHRRSMSSFQVICRTSCKFHIADNRRTTAFSGSVLFR